jgi:hypothetical protein
MEKKDGELKKRRRERSEKIGISQLNHLALLPDDRVFAPKIKKTRKAIL